MAEADRVVVELIAKNDQFDARNKQSAAAFAANSKQMLGAADDMEKAAGQVYTAHNKIGLATNNARIAQMELQHVVRGSVDQFAAGAAPATIFAQHIASVAEAATFMGGSLGSVGAVLAGPWGLAVTAGTAILATFIARHHEAGDGVDALVDKLRKHHDQTELNTEAQRIYDKTVEGSIDAMNKLTVEIDKQNLTLEDNIALKKAAIAGSLADVVGNIGTISAQLSQAVLAAREAKRILDDMESGRLSLGENPTAAILAQQGRVRDTKQQVSDLAAQLIGLSAAAEGGARALRSVDFPLIERNAKAAQNPIEAINIKFDNMAAAAKKAGTFTQSLANDLERQRAAAIKAAEANDRLGKSSGQFGRQVSFADAESIARGAGLRVTSGYRSTEHQSELFNDPSVNRPGNPVARPGTSAHEGVNGKWALDIAFAPGLTAQSLKKLYGDEGVTLSAVYKEAGHFHIEGSRSQAAVQDRAASRAAEEASREEQRRQEKLFSLMNDKAKVEIKSVSLVDEYNRGLSLSETLAGQNEEALKAWLPVFDQVKGSMEELNYFGGQLIDDVLNPNNWSSWGDMGKRVLHEIEMEIIQLAAINPLKNLLFGSKLPTLLSGLTGLFGGGSGLGQSLFPISGGVDPLAALPPRASGGPVTAGQSYLVGERGPERFVPSGNGTIIPSNATAATPGGGLSPGMVRVLIEASPYFDGRVMQVSGPVIAQASVAAANGGASISRRNLGRESMHRLE